MKILSPVLGGGEVDGGMGVGVVAGGVLAAVEIHDGVVDTLDARAVEETVALLGDDAGDEAFVGIVVEDDGVRHVFVLALFEEGPAVDLASGVGDGTGAEYLLVEVDTYIVGFEFHAVIFDGAFGEELCLAFVDVDGNGVGGLVMDDGGKGVGRGEERRERGGAAKGVEGVSNGGECVGNCEEAVGGVMERIGQDFFRDGVKR